MKAIAGREQASQPQHINVPSAVEQGWRPLQIGGEGAVKGLTQICKLLFEEGAYDVVLRPDLLAQRLSTLLPAGCRFRNDPGLKMVPEIGVIFEPDLPRKPQQDI